MKTITISYDTVSAEFGCDESEIPEGYQIVIKEYVDVSFMGDEALAQCEHDEDDEPYYKWIYGYVGEVQS